MTATNAKAARGTAVLVFSQGGYFILGYLAVVLLAREFGPAIYGTYGIIMSILVWLEEAGRFAIPSAAAKLLAETTSSRAELERATLTLNLGMHAALFLLLWVAAPLLASWFGIVNGSFLFRLAAIDLPFFGAYTAYRAIHQGHGRFFRLGCSQIIYALSKLVGVLVLIHFSLSLTNALLVNVAATIIGLAFLIPGSGVQWRGRWMEQVAPLMSTAIPVGLYYFVLGLRSSLVLWTLQIMSPASEKITIGIFVAAFNIARVPSMALTTVTTVILPSLSRALARNDESLAKRYINQGFRFGLILYLPVCLFLMTQPENLLQWIFSRDFSGGGAVLALLVAGEGLRVFHAILGSILNAAGEARKAAIVTICSLVPCIGMLVILIHVLGSLGAALSSTLILFFSSVMLSIPVWKRFGALMKKRSACNIGVSGCVMFLVFVLLSDLELFFLLPYVGGLLAYFASLIVCQEITRQDVAPFVPWIKLKRYQASNG